MLAPDAQLLLHEELLAGDPTAPARVAATLLSPLIEKLHRAHRRVDRDLLTTAAIDAWHQYVKAPGKFDPSRGKTLLGYLKMAAEGDLLNALDRAKRDKRRLVELDALPPVEVERLLRNREGRFDEDPQARLELSEDQKQAAAMYRLLDELFPSSIDRQLVELILANERKTESYAQILGLQHLTKQEQQREVKRHKDRINKRLRRYGHELKAR